ARRDLRSRRPFAVRFDRSRDRPSAPLRERRIAREAAGGRIRSRADRLSEPHLAFRLVAELESLRLPRAAERTVARIRSLRAAPPRARRRESVDGSQPHRRGPEEMTRAAVILAGGAGTRLRPLSSDENPKQFLKLFDGQSLLQKTFARVRRVLEPRHIF